MKTYKVLTIALVLFMLMGACAKPTEEATTPSAEMQDEATSSSAEEQDEATSSSAEEQDEATAIPSESTDGMEEVPYVNYLWTTAADYQAATGKTIDNLYESPMLTEEVVAGNLPPVEERLPKDFGIVRPRDEIGNYGGEMYLLGFNEGVGVYSEFTEYMQKGLLTTDPSFQTWYPELARDWKLADDGKSFTFYLREGMKWSDGADFTANDFEFWYVDILQNAELNPEISSMYKPGGELMGFNKIDDYTIEFTFAIPYYRAIDVMGTGQIARPAHYLKQFMPKYNANAETLAAEAGYDTWQAYAIAKGAGEQSVYNADPDYPVLNPWMVSDIGTDSTLWVRNPYYFEVDTAGNQMPYIDTLIILTTDNVAMVGAVKSLAGELDINDAGIGLADYSVLKENETDGNYTVNLWPRSDESTAMGFVLNFTEQDPELNKIFNDLRFRQALSMAIDRETISETIFLGLTEPFNGPASPGWTGYEDWMGSYYAEFSPDKANALLDEMGLEWDSNNEWRLMPDGRPVSFIGTWCTEWLDYSEDLLDLVVKDWAAVGVKMDLKFVPEDTLQSLFVANETDIGISNSDGGSERQARTNYPIRLIPPWHWGNPSCCAMSSYGWRQWLDTDGKNGIEPPQEIKDLYNIAMEWLDTPVGTPEYAELANQMITMNVENLYYIGTVSAAPRVVVISNRLGNVPREDGAFEPRGEYNPETYFLRP